jgi:hypothetical protein
MSEPFAELLAFCRDNGRLCPVPMRWNALYQMLPETRRKGLGWEPALPLILAAWWEASEDQKQERLIEHIRWARDHGVLDVVAKFLHSLPESEWHHTGD